MSMADPFRENADRAFAGADHGELLRAGEGLFALADLVDHEPRLRKALTDPAVSADAKRSLLGNLVRDRVSDLALTVAEDVVGARLREHELTEDLDALAAEAVFAAADRAGDLERVEDEVFRFSRIYAQAGELRQALTDPVLPLDAKQAVVAELLTGKASDETLLLVRQLIARGRAHDLDRALAGMAAMAAARRGRVVAEVRSAVELDEGRRQRLAAALQEAVGRPVELHLVLDPTVVGSLAVRVGDELYDGTVRRQLETARERLLAG
jgi:F-type H+-transporting ATPase subunit delta